MKEDHENISLKTKVKNFWSDGTQFIRMATRWRPFYFFVTIAELLTLKEEVSHAKQFVAQSLTEVQKSPSFSSMKHHVKPQRVVSQREEHSTIATKSYRKYMVKAEGNGITPQIIKGSWHQGKGQTISIF